MTATADWIAGGACLSAAATLTLLSPRIERFLTRLFVARDVRRERKAAIRACRRRGGHFWHPADSMIAWSCCCCPATADGTPKDGPGLHPRHAGSRIDW